MKKRWLPVLLVMAAGTQASSDDKLAPHGLGLLAGRVTDGAAPERLRAAQADIAPSGCVHHHISLLRGVDTRLDLEAIRAVSGWGYSPTMLEGEAVPITMTVTVNFRLSR